jgi:predicted histone-like DNA-binding protein
MPLEYKIVSTHQPGKGKEGKQLWFPKLTGSSKISQKEIARIMEKRSSASLADVSMVMSGFLDLLPELLLDGNTVHLDHLGTFRLHAKVTPESSPEKVTANNIKELRISFIPGKDIKEELQKAKFRLVK